VEVIVVVATSQLKKKKNLAKKTREIKQKTLLPQHNAH